MRKRFKTPSKTSPKGGRRGCLCADNTYSIKCCDGSLQAQGIGRILILETTPPNGTYGYKIQRCGHSQHKHIWGSQELVVGNVYYFDLVHAGHSNCYTVLQADSETSGFEWQSVTLYNDCTDCINNN
jgi:hypothetical protein